MSPERTIQPPTGTETATNGSAPARRFAPADLAGFALIALVALAVHATIGFDSLVAAVVVLAGVGLLVLAERRLTDAGPATARHAAGTRTA
jgi:hypothetical protein